MARLDYGRWFLATRSLQPSRRKHVHGCSAIHLMEDDAMGFQFEQVPIPTDPALTTYSSRCPNCDQRFGPAGPRQVYCSPRCKSEAEAVRYARRRIAEYPDGWPEDIEYAITIQIAHALAGGYDKEGRRLAPEVRAAVIERAKRRCEMCGEPGVDIDHIDGPSADLGNLRLLCKGCHEMVTRSHLVPIVDETDAAQHEALWRRIRAAEAERPSDDADWPSKWSEWVKSQRSPTPTRDLI